MRKPILLLGAALLGLSAATQATETITYSYDARGRIIEVKRSGTVNDGVVTSYAFDKADNRTSKTKTP